MTTEIFNCYFQKEWLYKHKKTGKLGMYATDDELITACLDSDRYAARCSCDRDFEDSPILEKALGQELISSIYTDTECEILDLDSLGNYTQLTEDEQEDFDEFEVPLYDVFIEIESE